MDSKEINHNNEAEVKNDSQAALMETLVKNSEKQLFYSRIAAFAALAAAAALVICFIVLVPSVMKTISQANSVMIQASDTIILADEAIKSVTEMSGAIKDMGNNMDSLIAENSESIAEVMKKLEAIDFDGLNSAIKDLGDVVEPFANFFGKFK